jgi:hypothetical protein
MAGYAVSTLADMPDVPTFTDPGDPVWKPIQHYLGLTAFGINAFTAKAAGDTIAAPHDEEDFGQEEVYVVVAGCARVTVGDDEMDAPAGTVVAVRDPALTRSVVAVDAGTTVLAVGCAPGCFRTSWRPDHFEGLPRHPAVEH